MRKEGLGNLKLTRQTESKRDRRKYKVTYLTSLFISMPENGKNSKVTVIV